MFVDCFKLFIEHPSLVLREINSKDFIQDQNNLDRRQEEKKNRKKFGL